MSTAIFRGGKIQEFLADVVTSEDHRLTSTVSSFSTDAGAKISDHIVINPDEVTISFEFTNKEDDTTNSRGERASKLFEQLKQARLDRDLLEVVTLHFLYQNMVVADIQASHSGPFTGRLICSVRFVEFPEFTISVREISEKNLAGLVSKTASSQKDFGRVDGEEVQSSLAFRLLKDFFQL